MPVVDTDRLRTFDAYAKEYPNRQGGLGVRTSYIYQLYKAGKLPVEHLLICGIHFVLLPEKTG